MKKLFVRITLLIFIFNIISVPSMATSSKIEVGDYIYLGTYLERPILWQCVDIDENGPLMYSVRAISCKAFDVEGKSTKGSHANSYARRSEKGSNRWADSNLRAWLNSRGEVEYPCGNKPNEYDNYYAYKTFWSREELYDYLEKQGENKLEKGFLTGFTESELEFVKQVEITTPIYEKEFPDMKPYERAISDEEKALIENPDVKAVKYEHKKYPAMVAYFLGEEAVGIFEGHLYEEKTADKFFLPSVMQLAVLEGKNKWREDVENLTYKYITEECFSAFRISEGPGFYEEIEDYLFAVGLRTPNTKTPDLVCAAADDHLPQQYEVTNETSYSNVYKGVKRSDYANSGLHIIAPMFYFNESAGKFACGDGSRQNPYSVEESGVQIIINGKNFSHKSESFVENGITMVSAKRICEALGIMYSDENIRWSNSGKDGEFFLSRADHTYMLTEESDVAVDVEEKTAHKLLSAVKVIDEDIYVPLRNICELFGFEINWDGENSNVIIKSDINTILYNYTNNVYPHFESFYCTDTSGGIYDYKSAKPYLDEYVNCLAKMGVHYVESVEENDIVKIKYSYIGAPLDDYLEIIINKKTATFHINEPHYGGYEG